MGWLRQESPYERRMRELEEEAERIRKNMQMLMKNTPREPSVSRVAAPPGLRKRSSVLPGPGYVGGDDLDPEPVDESPLPDEENTDAEPRDGMDRGAEAGMRPAPGPAMRQQERLASYLASGSFGKAGSLSRERRIQRNKAIFMAIVALIAIFSLLTWLK